MAVGLHASSASISIDSESDTRRADRGDTVTSVLAELLNRFEQFEIAATWAFHDPARTALARQISHRPSAHEIAVLDDATTAHAEFSRSYLLNGLGRRIQSASAAGITISTLAVFDDWQPRNVDLLTKLGLTMVRGCEPLARNVHGTVRAKRGIQSICYGLSYAPTATVVHGGKWFANRLQVRQVYRAIDRAILRGDHCHFCIDAASLAAGDISDALQSIDRWLRHLAQLRQAGRITVTTLRESVQSVRPKRAFAAQSILRAA